MRLIYLAGISEGVGGAILALSLVYKDQRLFYVSLVPLAITIIVAFANTFLREKVGFIHLTDLMFSNILAYLYAFSQMLVAGYFIVQLQSFVYDACTVFLMTFIFLVGITLIGLIKTSETDGKERSKEIISRFILFSLVFGVVMTLARTAFVYIYLYLPTPSGLGLGFNTSATILFATAAALMLITGAILRQRYEPLVHTDRKA